MRRNRLNILRKLLTMWVCALLLVSAVPTVSAFANTTTPTGGAPATSTSANASKLVVGGLQQELQVQPTTVELLFQVQGDYADLTKEFDFKLTIPEGMSVINALIDDKPITLSAENDTVTLSAGQRLTLVGIPASESYVLTQTDASVAPSPSAAGAWYNPQVTTASNITAALANNNARVLTLSEIEGTSTSPARVTITNTLPNNKVPATGLDDNTSPWLVVLLVSAGVLAGLCAFRLSRRLRRSRM